MEHKVVEVFWIDATYEACENTELELKKLKPVPRSHVGYVLEETNVFIRLSSGANYWSSIKDSDDTFDNSIAIPKGMITEPIKELT